MHSYCDLTVFGLFGTRDIPLLGVLSRRAWDGRGAWDSWCKTCLNSGTNGRKFLRGWRFVEACMAFSEHSCPAKLGKWHRILLPIRFLTPRLMLVLIITHLAQVMEGLSVCFGLNMSVFISSSKRKRMQWHRETYVQLFHVITWLTRHTTTTKWNIHNLTANSLVALSCFKHFSFFGPPFSKTLQGLI